MAGEHFAFTGDSSQLIGALTSAKSAMHSLNQTAESTGQELDNVLSSSKDVVKQLAGMAGISISVAGIAAFGKKMFDVRSQMQDLTSTMTVFLGSAEKAEDFTKKLQDYAYWNMFEFTDLTEASTQLMAYGTATEDLIPTIDKLSNIATGAKKPLEQYVNLFNKAKSTGKVDSIGLQQWAAAGIVLKDELKALGEEVDGNTISFEQLQKVLDSVTGEGGRYAGLMMSQMDNLSASWGQLEDNLANMFNELGTKMQGVMKGGIDALSFVIDHYEQFGKVLMTIIAMYGEYKAILLVTAAAKKAAALWDNIQLVMMFRKELGLLKAAQQAFNITAMQNPYVLLAVAVVTTVTAIAGLVSAFKDERTGLEQVNDAYDENKKQTEEEVRLAGEQIRTLKDKTASTYALVEARKELAEMFGEDDFFKGFDFGSASVEQIEQKIKEYKDYKDQLNKEEKNQGLKQNEAELVQRYQSSARTVNANPDIKYDASNAAAIQLLEQHKREMEDAQNQLFAIDQQRVTEFTASLSEANKPLEEQKDIYERNIAKKEGYISAINKEMAEINSSKKPTAEQQKRLADLQLMYARLTNQVVLFNDALRNVNNEMSVQAEAPKTYAEGVQKHLENQKKIKELQAKYKADMSDDNKEKLEKLINEDKALVANLDLAGDYTAGQKKAQQARQKATQNSKKSADEAKKAQEEILRDQRNAANERIRIENSRIQAQMVARKAELDLQLKQIDEESKAWSKAHKGMVNKAFEQKAANLKLKFDIDTEKADKQFAEWKKNFERQTLQIGTDMEISFLQQQIALETDVTKQIELQNQLYEKQTQQKLDALDLERDQYLEQKYGDKTLEDFNAFRNQEGSENLLERFLAASKDEKSAIAKESGMSEELLATYAQMEEVFDQYAERYQKTVQQTIQEKGIVDFNAELERLQTYYDEVEQIEQEHSDKLRDLAENGGTKDMIAKENELYEKRKAQAGKLLSGNEAEKAFAERMNSFALSIAGQTYEEIENQYKIFIKALDKDISALEDELAPSRDLDAARASLTKFDNGLSEEDKALNEEQKNAKYEERATIVKLIADLEGKQTLTDDERIQKEQQLNMLLKGRSMAEKSTMSAESSAMTNREMLQAKFSSDLNHTLEGFSAVKDAAKSLSDTLGGALSEDGKKALESVMAIADIGVQSCQAIEAVSNAASISIWTTANAMQNAVIILQAISAIVQLAMAAVKFFSQFTASAKMQDEIDKTKEKVDDLKKQQDNLEKAYKRQTGIEYYKGMAAAAKKYDEVLAQNNQALAEAERLYEYQKAQYGEDSDKAKDAKKQYEDLLDAGEEYKDAQKEIYDELAESLLTTNVTSFAEGLADDLVEAWQNGTNNMEEIWDNMLDDLQRDMMKKALSIALTDMFESTFSRISKLAQNGELTQSEIDAAINEIDAKSAEAQAIAEQWRQAMSQRGLLDDANPEADAGGFGSMSQDTADELNARFTALQMEGASVVASTSSMLENVEIVRDSMERQSMIMQDIYHFQQLAYEQAQESIELVRAISEHTQQIATHTSRLKQIEINTNELRS